MSTTNTDSGSDGSDADPLNDPEDWQALDRDEQDRLLSERQEERESEEQQEAIEAAREHEGAREQLAGLLGTWEATISGKRGEVTVECHELSDPQDEAVLDRAGDLAEVQAAGDTENVEVEMFDSIDELYDWLNGFLAEITVDDELDADYWEHGRYPGSGRFQLFFATVEQAGGKLEAVEGFR